MDTAAIMIIQVPVLDSIGVTNASCSNVTYCEWGGGWCEPDGGYLGTVTYGTDDGNHGRILALSHRAPADSVARA